MRKTLVQFLAFVTFSASASAFASAAVIYNCVGTNTAEEYGSSVMFSIVYADSVPEYGYTRQELEIVRDGWDAPAQPLTFRLDGKKTCKVNSDGVIEAGNTKIEWLESTDKDIQTKISVEIVCDQFKFKTVASCLVN